MDNFSESLIEKTTRVRKSGLTFAAEAGTQRLRDVINKNVTWDEIEKTCRIAFEAGYTSVKLYFMMGLPTETMADIEGIAETAQKVVDLYYHTQTHAKGKGVQVTVSCACFVPMPHTPFQFVPMDSAETLQPSRSTCWRASTAGDQGQLPRQQDQFLEGVFAKGDRRLAPALVEAYRRGCVFDGWESASGTTSGCRPLRTWHRPSFLLQPGHRPGRGDPVGPHGLRHHPQNTWCGRYKKALAAQTTPPCNRACSGCGANRLLGGPCFDYSADLV